MKTKIGVEIKPMSNEEKKNGDKWVNNFVILKPKQQTQQQRLTICSIRTFLYL